MIPVETLSARYSCTKISDVNVVQADRWHACEVSAGKVPSQKIIDVNVVRADTSSLVKSISAGISIPNIINTM